MGSSGKKVYGDGFLKGIALFGKAFCVPGQGGRVAGDIDHPFRRHLHNGVYDVGGQPLSGRVHGNYVGTDPL